MKNLVERELGSVSEICKTIVEEVSIKVTEDYEKFVFETLRPYCNEVAKTVVSKKDLEQALTQYFSKEPCEDAIDREYLFKVLDDFCGHDRTATITLDTLADLVYELPSVTQKSDKWITVSERLPNKSEWVLVTTEDHQKPIEIMCYRGVQIGQHNVGNGWEEYEYPSWTSGHGDIQSHHPKAWMSLPKPYEPQESEDKR